MLGPERRCHKFRRVVQKGMVDSVSSAQATALEIPVTIQGARPVDGTEQRELFTETTKTTLVFENGAVVNLNSRVSLGQCVFLRNDQSGREVLCKVLEWRQVGQAGYTDLEFTARDSDFWGVQADQVSTAGGKPEAHKALESPGENPLIILSTESGAPTGGEMPATFVEAAARTLSCTSPLTAEALIAPANRLNCSDAKDAEPLPAQVADDAGPQPEQESITHTTEIERETLFADMAQSDETSADTAGETGELTTRMSRTLTARKIIAGKTSIAIGIAASLSFVVVSGATWHAKRGFSIQKDDRPFAASAQSGQHSRPIAARSSQLPASHVAKGGTTTAGTVSTNTIPSVVVTEAHAEGNNGGATRDQAAQTTQAAPVSQEFGDAVGQHPTATTEDVGAVRESNSVADSKASVISKVEAIGSTPGSDPAGLGQLKLQNSDVLTTNVVPAKIVSQSLPSIPSWAKGLDTDAVVRLDAVIDEKGNVAQTKPLSGPRVLQRVAEQAVALWIFEPALSDGKPTATHMVLTVQFQR